MSIVKIDQIMRKDINNPFVDIDNLQNGGVISLTVIRNSTRIAISTATQAVAFSGTFKKFKANTIIRSTCTVFGDGYYDGNCGVGMVINGSLWDHGCAYQYDGSWSATLQTTVITGSSIWSNIGIGTHTIGFGWRPANAVASKPFNYINPSSSTESRNQQMSSTIFVYEVV